MSDKNLSYEIMQQKNCFQGYFRIDQYHIRIASFAGGNIEFTREVFERGHAVSVLPYDPRRDKVILIEQFRIGAAKAGREAWIMEPVAGIIEPGESAQDVAVREGIEEANCRFEHLIPVYDYLVSPGACTETVKLYCGLCDSEGLGGVFGLPEEGEDIKVHILSRAEANALLQNGRAANAMTIIALQWLQLNHQSLQADASG